jgi:hypothetical protein
MLAADRTVMTTPPATENRTVYRIVLTNPPTLRDFLSDEELGKPPRSADPVVRRVWSGISTYQTQSQARRKARAYPWLGGFIACLEIPAHAPVRIERTFPRSAGHHTLWGVAADVLQYVVRVVPV